MLRQQLHPTTPQEVAWVRTHGPPPAGHLQQLRALTVLEMIGTREANALLDVLARGERESWRTREAQAAKQRLAGTPSP
jgi:hypothetical protein